MTTQQTNRYRPFDNRHADNRPIIWRR